MENRPKERVTIGRIFGILYPFAIDYAVQIIVVIAFAFYIAAANPEVISNRDEYTKLTLKHAITMTLIADGILIPIMGLLMWFDKKRLKKRGYKRVLQNVKISHYLLIIPFSFFGMMVCNLLATFALSGLPESFTKSYDSSAASIYGGDRVIMVIAVCLVGPVLEELMFRGVIYNRIKEITNPIVAIVLSAIAFGAFHLNWVQGIYAATLGTLLAYLYYKYKTIWASIIMHVTCNTISIIATFASKEGVEGAANGTEKVAVTGILIKGFFVYLIITVILFIVIHNTVKVKELFITENVQNPYGKYNELNNPYGYNPNMNGYNPNMNGYDQNYNQNYNQNNYQNNIQNQNGYNGNQWIDDYLASQGNNSNENK